VILHNIAFVDERGAHVQVWFIRDETALPHLLADENGHPLCLLLVRNAPVHVESSSQLSDCTFQHHCVSRSNNGFAVVKYNTLKELILISIAELIG